MVRKMLEIIENKNPKEKPNQSLCEAYLFVNSNLFGRFPLLIYPDEDFKHDKKKMYPITIHSIWFLDIESKRSIEQIELEYSGKIYFAEKFRLKSKIKNSHLGNSEDQCYPEDLVFFVVLPIEFREFGHDLLKKLINGILTNFEFSLYYLIESETAKKLKSIPTEAKQKLDKNKKLKNEIKKFIKKVCVEFASNIIEQKNANLLNQKKALSYFSLKDVDISYILSYQEDGTPSIIKIFKKDNEAETIEPIQNPIEILNLNIDANGKELEILIKNQSKIMLNEVVVKLIHVEEFFEKEIMKEHIELWLPEEEILIISPIVPKMNEYLFLSIENENKERIFVKKIDFNMIKDITH
jgi:uncharacterized protein (DUF2147 family)